MNILPTLNHTNNDNHEGHNLICIARSGVITLQKYEYFFKFINFKFLIYNKNKVKTYYEGFKVLTKVIHFNLQIHVMMIINNTNN